jgi:hypothetical protein
MDHDQLFKRLLWLFLPEFLQLFLPFASGGIRLVRYSERVLGHTYPKLAYWRIGLRGLEAAP